jgi:hypothetical protein
VAIFLMVPLGLLGIAIAVLPLLLGSIYVDRMERAAAAKRSRSAGSGEAARDVCPVLTVSCPMCLDYLDGSSPDQLVDAVHRHAWRAHGIPSPAHILESASRTVTSPNGLDRVPVGALVVD